MSDLISRMLANQRAAERDAQESKPLSAEELHTVTHQVAGSHLSGDPKTYYVLKRLLAQITHLEREIARLEEAFETARTALHNRAGLTE